MNGSDKIVVSGAPKLEKVSTSYAERSNLTLRMSMRHFTRLTNAFSKKIENHALMVAIFCAYYNYCRPHKSPGQGHHASYGSGSYGSCMDAGGSGTGYR